MNQKEEVLGLLAEQGIHFEKSQIADRKSQISVSVWGTGKPLREFMYSGDMADATVYIMEKVAFKELRGEGSEVRNTHINIGTGEEITIKDPGRIIEGNDRVQG